MYDLSSLGEVRKTERLLLRPFLLEDADAFYACLSSPDVLKYEDRAPLTEEGALDELRVRTEDVGSIAICLPPTEDMPFGTLIGFVSVYEVEGSVFLGYMIRADEQRKGYAREACDAVLDVLFSLGIGGVLALSELENQGSVALLSRLGFVLCETYRDERGNEVGVYLCKAR